MIVRPTSATSRPRSSRWPGFLAILGLIGPSIILVVATLVPALALLLVNSVYRVVSSRVEQVVTFDSYRSFFTDPFYGHVVLQGVRLAVTTTVLCLLLGYPAAYAMAKIRRPVWIMVSYVVIFSPLLTSSVVRAYGWLIILGRGGIINWVLEQFHIVESPIRLIFNFTGVTIGLVHFLLPFTVFPILSVLLRLDPAIREAAADLGATRLQTFGRITLPLSASGVYAAALLTFVLAMNAFVTPQLLGGGRVLVLPTVIYQNISNLQWPLAAVQSLVLMVLVWVTVFVSNLLVRRAVPVA
jgi:putative spermidine/putrescine transport system permease protein